MEMRRSVMARPNLSCRAMECAVLRESKSVRGFEKGEEYAHYEQQGRVVSFPNGRHKRFPLYPRLKLRPAPSLKPGFTHRPQRSKTSALDYSSTAAIGWQKPGKSKTLSNRRGFALEAGN